MRHHEFLSEDELFEINMSPSNLQKLAKDLPDAKFGLEFELIVPNTDSGDDGDYENDYDYDERARSFEGIEDFFSGGDGNNSRRDVRNMIEAIKENYYDWANEKRWEEWADNGFDFFKDYAEELFDEEDAEDEARDEIETEFPELDKNSEEFIEKVAALVEDKKDTWLREEWENQGSLYDDAREQWEDGQEWPDEQDFLENEGYRYMSDLERVGHDHDVYWPHQSQSGNGEADMNQVAESIGYALGVEVKVGGYHNISRSNQESEGFWILETDGSLVPNDGSEAGLELVSPPLTLEAMKKAVKVVAEWAESAGAYTGKYNKTGLHMNVSVPGYSQDKLDFVKLALLLGDNHILKEFDRMSYSYAKSSFDLLSGKMKSSPDLAKKALNTMKGHFDMAASKALHSGSTDKYTSINVKDNRVEFRGPGGDYLKLFEKDPNKLFAPMMRFAVALDAAIDPNKYRDEYQKKLYKFLNKAVKGNGDALSLFTDYAAGKGFAQSAYKSFLKKRKSERDLDRELKRQDQELRSPGEGIRVGGRKSNPDGEWILFRQHRPADGMPPYGVEVLYRFNAASKEDVEIVRDQYVDEHKPSFQVMMGSDPTKKNGQPGDYKDASKQPDDNSKGNWGIYRISDGTRMKYNGNYVKFGNSTKAQAEADMSALFRTAHTTAQIQDYELRRLTKYEIYTRDDGRPVTRENGEPLHFEAGSFAEAEQKMPRIISDFNIGSGNANDYDVRSVLDVPAHTTTSSGEMLLYNVRRLSTDSIAAAFRVPNHAAAVQKFHDFLARTSSENHNNFRLERADSNGESTGETRTYELYSRSTGAVMDTFPARNDDEALVRLRDYTRLGAGREDPENFGVRRQGETPRAADGSEQATASSGVPMWVIYRISDGEVVHNFADHAVSHSRTALAWLRDQGFENPQTTFRVRAMSQNEQQSTAVPGSTVDRQQQRAQASQGEWWEIFNMDSGEIWGYIQANSIEQAEEEMESKLRNAGIDPDRYDARISRDDPEERQSVRDINLFPDIEPTQRNAIPQFTGTWLVKNENTGEVLHRISGIGNVQADANRIAGNWVRQNSIAVPIEVVPEMQ